MALDGLEGDSWTEALHPEDVERCKEIDLNCLPVDHRFTLDYRLRCHDGRYVWMMDSAMPCHAPMGNSTTTWAWPSTSMSDVFSRTSSPTACRRCERRAGFEAERQSDTSPSSSPSQ